MTTEQKRTHPIALWFIAGSLLGASINIGVAGKAIATQISVGNTMYLCIESWKMGIFDNETCQKIIRPGKTRDAA